MAITSISDVDVIINQANAMLAQGIISKEKAREAIRTARGALSNFMRTQAGAPSVGPTDLGAGVFHGGRGLGPTIGGTNGDTAADTPTREQIESDFKAGVLTAEEAAAMLLDHHGLRNGADIVTFWDGGGTGTNVPVAELVPDPDPVPRPTPEPSAETDEVAQSRAGLFQSQVEMDDRELQLRLLADTFGTRLSPVARRGANLALEQFSQIDPLLEFANPQQTLGNRFSAFAGGNRLSGSQLGGILGQLTDIAPTDPAAFLDFVPDYAMAAQLGVQPGFADVNPNLRRRAIKRRLSDFEIQRAQTPELFQDPSAENLAGIIESFRRQGFLNDQ
jgi:hypothetical protein